MSDRVAVVLSRSHADEAGRREMEEAVEAALAGRVDVGLILVADIYDLTDDSTAVERLRATGGDLIVLAWTFPRPAYWILATNRIEGRPGPSDGPDRAIWCLDLRKFDQAQAVVDEVARLASAARGSSDNGADVVRLDESLEPRWYPVIDFDRCTNCLECLNFCLFGVFDADESDSIVIAEPDACRDGCPACSRICPAGAIMFPRHTDSAIAGDPEASPGALKLDLSQLLGGFDPTDLAAGERDQAMVEKNRGQSDLDKLVDDIDDMDL